MNSFKKVLQKIIAEDKPENILNLVIYLSRKIINSGNYENNILNNFLKILSQLCYISSTKINSKISTACIKRSENIYSLEFSPEFLLKYISDESHLIHLIFHELLHKLFGDLFKQVDLKNCSLKRKQFIQNAVADITINNYLLNEYNLCPQYLKKLYYNKGVISSLLLPPHHIYGRDWDKRKLIIKNYFKKTVQKEKFKFDLDSVLNFYYKCWFDMRATFEKLCLMLNDLLPEEEYLEYDLIIFIGEHNNNSNDENWDYLKSKIRKYFDIYSWGYSEEIQEEKIKVKEYEWQEFLNIIKKALILDPANKKLTETLISQSSVVPSFGRREIFYLANNYFPLFYNNYFYGKDFDDYSLKIYLDVSGSTGRYWDKIYGLIKYFRQEIGDTVYLFSNAVKEIKVSELIKGTVKTTFGTSFDIVAKHCLQNNFKKILMITDGDGYIQNNLVFDLQRKNIEIFTAFIPYYQPNSILKKVSKQWWKMPF